MKFFGLNGNFNDEKSLLLNRIFDLKESIE
jgi:hypothetical protein